MGIQTYNTQAGRINKMAGEFVAHAMATEVLAQSCKQIKMPKNKSETLIVASWVPYGGTVAQPNIFNVSAAAHIVAEGVTPNADTIVRRDVTFVLNQYACLYALTDKDADIHEDPVADGMKEQVGERMGLVREMAIYGGMKAATNKFYAGGASRTTVAGKITERFMQGIIRSLKRNHAKMVRPALSASEDYGTSAVEASYIAYVHTDAEPDIRALPGFKETAIYGQKSLINEHELGSWQSVRFIVSAELNSYPNAGAAVAGLGLQSTGGTNADVYPLIVVGKEAFAQVELRGMSAIEPIYLPVDKADKADPLNQRGYIGAKFWHTSGVLNPGWIAVGEVGVSDLLS